MSLLPVEEAISRLLDPVLPLGSELVPLAEAGGRVLAANLAAERTQPPFPASAMDGYAVRAAEAETGARLRVVGESRAGERFSGSLGPGEAVRIFTGAPVPEGADSILIQENAEREGDTILVREPVKPGRFIRPAGLDFRNGDVLLRRGRRLEARAISLAASMGHAALPVRQRPRVAILANGDELVPPGTEPGHQHQRHRVAQLEQHRATARPGHQLHERQLLVPRQPQPRGANAPAPGRRRRSRLR
jgi:molybdopterin molybdotransferase